MRLVAAWRRGQRSGEVVTDEQAKNPHGGGYGTVQHARMRDGNLGVTQAPTSRLQRHLDRPAVVVREIGESERHLDPPPAGTESCPHA